MTLYDLDKNAIKSVEEVDKMIEEADSPKERTRLEFEKMLRGLKLASQGSGYAF